MIQVIYKQKLNNDELHKYYSDWADEFRVNTRGTYLCNSHIYVCPSSKSSIFSDSTTTMSVYGYNGIKLGEFHPDHGCIWGDNGIYAYYPILTFYNDLNKVGINYNCGQPNNLRIEPTQQGLIINEENMLKCIRDSFEYIKIFKDKEVCQK